MKHIIFSLLAILFVGCSSVQKNTTQLGDLSGNWKLQTLEGDIISSPQPLTIELTSDKKIYGFTGCNRLTGSYSFEEDNEIKLSDLGSTRMMCSPAEMNLETKFMNALKEVRSTSVDEGVLKMYDAKDNLIATFIKELDLDLTNANWQLEELNGEIFDNSSLVTLNFNDDHIVSGNSACNRFHANYLLEENLLSFSEIATTRMSCGDEDMEIERSFLDTLEGARKSSVENGKLILLDGNNQVLAKFSKYEESEVVNKYWKLIELEGASVEMDEHQEREQYFLLKNNGTITGFAGCNQFNGTYTLDEENKRLSFGEDMAITLKLCPDSKANEQQFLEVLSKADNYTIDGEKLYVTIGKRAPLAVFEAVYF